MRSAIILFALLVCSSVSYGQFNRYHSSTAEEGARRGHASQMRAYGRMQKDIAESQVLRQKAYNMFLRNNRDRVRNYYEKKLIRLRAIEELHQQKKQISARKKRENLEWFASRKPKKRNPAKRGKDFWIEKKDFGEGPPLEVVRFHWPVVLEPHSQRHFVNHAKSLEFHATGSWNAKHHAYDDYWIEDYEAAEQWLKNYLQKNPKMPPAHYIKAKRFLEKVKDFIIVQELKD